MLVVEGQRVEAAAGKDFENDPADRRKSRHSREACHRKSGERESSLSGDMDPRLRGGDEGLTFISRGEPKAHEHSEGNRHELEKRGTGTVSSRSGEFTSPKSRGEFIPPICPSADR